MERVHHEVHERHAARPGVVEAEQPQHGPLDGDGGVAPRRTSSTCAGDPVGERAAARHHLRVEVQVRDLAPVGKSHGSFLRRRGGASNLASQRTPPSPARTRASAPRTDAVARGTGPWRTRATCRWPRRPGCAPPPPRAPDPGAPPGRQPTAAPRAPAARRRAGRPPRRAPGPPSPPPAFPAGARRRRRAGRRAAATRGGPACRGGRPPSRPGKPIITSAPTAAPGRGPGHALDDPRVPRGAVRAPHRREQPVGSALQREVEVLAEDGARLLGEERPAGTRAARPTRAGCAGPDRADATARRRSASERRGERSRPQPPRWTPESTTSGRRAPRAASRARHSVERERPGAAPGARHDAVGAGVVAAVLDLEHRRACTRSGRGRAVPGRARPSGPRRAPPLASSPSRSAEEPGDRGVVPRPDHRRDPGERGQELPLLLDVAARPRRCGPPGAPGRRDGPPAARRTRRRRSPSRWRPRTQSAVSPAAATRKPSGREPRRRRRRRRGPPGSRATPVVQAIRARSVHRPPPRRRRRRPPPARARRPAPAARRRTSARPSAARARPAPLPLVPVPHLDPHRDRPGRRRARRPSGPPRPGSDRARPPPSVPTTTRAGSGSMRTT